MTTKFDDSFKVCQIQIIIKVIFREEINIWITKQQHSHFQ